MKRFGFAALAVMMLVATVGCRGAYRNGCNDGCGYGGGHGGGGHGGGGLHGGYTQPAPTHDGAHVGYPYYTTRGPRDYFLNNPPSIGR